MNNEITKEKNWIWKRLKFSDDGGILLNQLYLYFKINKDFFVWIKEVIKKYNLIEDEDYITFENVFKNEDEINKIGYLAFYNPKNNNLVLDAKKLYEKRA